MRFGRIAIVLFLALAAVSAAAAPQVQIKLGSLVPVGSSWDLALKKLASDWGRISGGQVKVVIYSGGTVGDEPSMIRKMKLGQLQAAGLTVRGLSHIYNPTLSLSLPMLTRNDAELDYLMREMRPELEAGIEENGYKVMFWTVLGWVYFYGRQPIVVPDDLRKQKLWVWEGDPDEASMWKELNFRIAPLQSTDILQALQTGMVDAFSSSPLTAAAYQWFALAPNMADLRWAPLFAGLVISTKSWEKIPADIRPRLLEAAQAVGDALRDDTVKGDAEAIRVMTQYGLKLTPVPQAAVDEWSAFVDQGFARLVGKTFDAVTTDKVRRLIREYRERNAR
jgi:TRAP-type transport system periplasmic protein